MAIVALGAEYLELAFLVADPHDRDGRDLSPNVIFRATAPVAAPSNQ